MPVLEGRFEIRGKYHTERDIPKAKGIRAKAQRKEQKLILPP